MLKSSFWAQFASVDTSSSRRPILIGMNMRPSFLSQVMLHGIWIRRFLRPTVSVAPIHWSTSIVVMRSGQRTQSPRARFLKKARNKEAQPYLQRATDLDSKVCDYQYWLGMSLEKSGNMSAARMRYQQALQLNQDSTEAKTRLTALEAK